MRPMMMMVYGENSKGYGGFIESSVEQVLELVLLCL